MNGFNALKDIIDEKLLNLHTCYIAKVLSFDGTTANVQPLGMIKQYGKPARKQSMVTGVPVIQSARYKLSTIMRTCRVTDISTEQREHLTVTPLAEGDLVVCVCADRDITEAKRGNIAQPQLGHHSMSDSIVIGVL